MKKIFVLCLVLFSASCFSGVMTLSEQRDIYKEAIDLQNQGLWDQASKKSELIIDYPLAYLLDYKNIKENFSKNELLVVQSFITNYGTYKAASDLQRKYLYYLGNNKYWDEFLSFYPRLPNSTSLKCFHFQAKMSQGKMAEILPVIEKMWLTGRSLPNSCDPVFKYYLQNEQLSKALIWQRFELAYRRNNNSLLSYLITLMTGEHKALAEQLYLLNKTPKKLVNSTLFNNRKEASYSFLLIAMKRLAKKDIKLAIETYRNYEEKMPFTFFDGVELKKYFVSRILIRNEDELLSWLDKELPNLGAPDLVERRIRYAIKADNWADIEYWLTKLPLKEKQKSKWQYWQARVLETKDEKQVDLAMSLYQQVATTRSYYGFLAAQKLGLAYQFNAQVVTSERQSLRYLYPQLNHIEELYFHQQNGLMKREWEALLKNRDAGLQQQLAFYAYQKGWAHLSVVATIRAKSWDALNVRFPEVSPDLFAAHANRYKLDPSYVYAITRQESSFDEFAYSPAGASGYMQLMPKTAQETAHKIGLKKYKQKAQLKQAEINLQLGTAYFDQLLKRYQGNRILATAAYNAGPHRVDRWQGNKKGRAEKGLAMDSWVETIPYKETRRYVKNVLAYNVIYQHIMEQPLEFLNDIELEARF